MNYLAIDGGGTKTDFMLADGDGNILSRVILEATNPNDVGFDKTFATLTEGIRTVCKNIPFEQISVFAGLAGCSSDENMPKIAEFLKAFNFAKAENHNDAQNAVSACLKDGDGVVVIMGTGSIAYAKKEKDLFRIGGYGYLFGDEGSGFAIGRDCILAALSFEDGSGDNTALYDAVKKRCGGETVLSKIDTFYEKGKQEIAKYAPLVFEAYSLEDKVAKEIIDKNLSAIAKMIIAGGLKLGKKEFRCVICGGLGARGDIIIPVLCDLIKKDGRANDIKITIETSSTPPVVGGLYLAGLTKEVKF